MPPEVINKAHTLQQTQEAIATAVDRSGVDRALEAREVYKEIADIIWEARNVTDNATAAVEASGDGTTPAVGDMLAAIQNRHAGIKVRDRYEHGGRVSLWHRRGFYC